MKASWDHMFTFIRNGMFIVPFSVMILMVSCDNKGHEKNVEKVFFKKNTIADIPVVKCVSFKDTITNSLNNFFIPKDFTLRKQLNEYFNINNRDVKIMSVTECENKFILTVFPPKTDSSLLVYLVLIDSAGNVLSDTFFSGYLNRNDSTGLSKEFYLSGELCGCEGIIHHKEITYDINSAKIKESHHKMYDVEFIIRGIGDFYYRGPIEKK